MTEIVDIEKQRDITAEYARFWALYNGLDKLPIDGKHMRTGILYALSESRRAPRTTDGVSVAWLAHKLNTTSGKIRHHLKELCADGAVVMTTKRGKTELFTVSEKVRCTAEDYLAVFRIPDWPT